MLFKRYSRKVIARLEFYVAKEAKPISVWAWKLSLCCLGLGGKVSNRT